MTRDLRDYALVKQNELTRILAGCAIVDPALVVELVRKLRPDDLTDEPARKFLLALTPESNPRELAASLGLCKEYTTWMGLGCDELWDIPRTARSATDEIKRLCVVRQGLTELQDWLKDAERIGGYAYVR